MEFTRHARRRMRLYEISQEEVEEAVSKPDKIDIESNRKVVYKIFAQRFKGMPLKVVYVKEEGDVVILSAYPLKKSYWREVP
ncbi:MAG: hypothetical protein A3E19_01240 [Planctomycetes bacterium RIFCSPHIGHO2_12_FULL_52_36]|nr:MAG: hypothetical protein A3E19_01240 [Planctomycetes bacterium RIFCSPHIGHO2_12_FULL_52_36]